MKKRILITGANGFIGKSIIELLDKTKYEIIPIVKPSISGVQTIYEYDIQDESDVDRMFDFFQNIDYVINCATVGGRRNKIETPHTFAANVIMFNNIFKHKDKYKHLIVFGSGAERRNGGFPLDFYGLSKKYITEQIKNNNYYNCTILRLWGCFGKYETDDRFIKSNIIRYLNKEDIIIHAHKRMDYFYVNDIIPILEAIFNRLITLREIDLSYPDRSQYQLGYLRKLAELINSCNDYKVAITVESGDIPEAYANFHGNPVLQGNWGFIGIEKGIKEVYNYLKHNNV